MSAFLVLAGWLLSLAVFGFVCYTAALADSCPGPKPWLARLILGLLNRPVVVRCDCPKAEPWPDPDPDDPWFIPAGHPTDLLWWEEPALEPLDDVRYEPDPPGPGWVGAVTGIPWAAPT